MRKQFEGFQENLIVLFNWCRSARLNSKFKVWAFWVLLCCRIAELCVHLLHSQIAFLHCVCFQMYCCIPPTVLRSFIGMPPSQVARLRGGFGRFCLTLLHMCVSDVSWHSNEFQHFFKALLGAAGHRTPYIQDRNIEERVGCQILWNINIF